MIHPNETYSTRDGQGISHITAETETFILLPCHPFATHGTWMDWLLLLSEGVVNCFTAG